MNKELARMIADGRAFVRSVKVDLTLTRKQSIDALKTSRGKGICNYGC